MTVQPTRDQLRALADKATPGPWRIGEAFDEPACWVAHLSDNGWDDNTTVTSQDTTGSADQEVRDAEFIAAARTAVPQLLDQLDQAEAIILRQDRYIEELESVDAVGLTARADQAEARVRDLTQEAKDERGAALDQIEQVRIRDARIKAVLSVVQEWESAEVRYDVAPIMRAASTRIRHALEG